MAVQASASEDLKAEINVTPLVDVVLVLLIIFMVVTPMLKQEVPIELPVAETSRAAADPSQITVGLSADGRAFVNGVELPAERLPERIAELYAGRADKTIFLEADRALPHGRIVDVMDAVRGAGVVQIGVVTKRGPAAGVSSEPAPGGVPATVPREDSP